VIDVTTGTTYTLAITAAQTIIVWRSATAGAKTTTLPASAAGNNGDEVTVKLTRGDNTVHTVQATAGTVEGQASVSFTDTAGAMHASLSFVSDGANTDWVIV
jgi:hypothetical protein